MNSIDVLTKKVADLEILASEVEDLGLKLLQKASIDKDYDTGKQQWSKLSQDLEVVQRDGIRKYQRWYNAAYQLVKEYIPQKEQEFLRCYEDKHTELGVIDMLQLRSAWFVDTSRSITKPFLDRFEIQRSILLSVPDVAEIKEFNLRKLITADVARTEIEQAEILLSNGFEKAAGSIAGVALELHLKTLCDINGLTYRPKDTIDPLATVLYKASTIDKIELNHIQYLASIRNSCSHSDPVSKKDVKALIEGVRKIV